MPSAAWHRSQFILPVIAKERGKTDWEPICWQSWKDVKTGYGKYLNARKIRLRDEAQLGQDTSGTTITNEEMESIIDDAEPYPRVIIKVEWRKSYYEHCIEFVDETMLELTKLGAPDDVRVIFCFV